MARDVRSEVSRRSDQAGSAERLWVALRNSQQWRRVARWEPARRVLRSPALQRLDVARRARRAAREQAREPAIFERVETYLMFVGHAKSGGTMLGSLLDAHPNAIVADEVDVLRFVDEGFGREQIFHLLVRASKQEMLKGRVTARRLEPYSFLVPGQWQGTSNDLRVIGESKAGPSTRRLAASPEELDHLMAVMTGVDTRIIQVVRNPFDPISTSVIRGNRSLGAAIDDYFAQCRNLTVLRERLDPSMLLVVRYEDFVADPTEQLRAICSFLGLEAEADYLRACGGVIDATPRTHRHEIEWSPRYVADVEQRAQAFEFLTGYRYVS